MLRKPSFLHELPKKVLSLFFEPEALVRLNMLKNKLRHKFPVSCGSKNVAVFIVFEILEGASIYLSMLCGQS